MKAVAFTRSLPIDAAGALVDIDLPVPEPLPHDLRVAVRAVSVNPVDTKVRRNGAHADGSPRVLGWDAVGVVEAVGSAVTRFQPGDRVWYAGSIARNGSNAELHLVDERLVGRAPASLTDAQAAALPLTGITAWELLFDRLLVSPGKRGRDSAAGESLLVMGAAGGVGSILVQLARRLTGLTVIGSASRPETQAWVRELGAHHVIDHGRPLGEELQRIGRPEVTHVASLTHTDAHFTQLVEALAPQGRIALIDDPEPIDVRLLKRKSASLHWELMFTRALFGTPDMVAQHHLLNDLAALVDDGVVRSTLGEHYGRITAANLTRAHALVESGRARGKIVLEGF
ncbi:zinc-binding alcohol dehydrogenase family protein [Methylibium petroleiphilum]|uniref:zinc-binding alcohol dehydrogenase family protein n=1 Tax=Methylibium petroleiphilum TaxID=105560 RepID=UPI001ACC7B47|nr:zinc-binding alcohol dehydrogenase family protein [Methylibium petroleiphilum]MBN9203296.1 zinc-binding alcohol dehydrogenase family protein [Methylibium petroleiphilum]